jgi:hypothetical protein
MIESFYNQDYWDPLSEEEEIVQDNNKNIGIAAIIVFASLFLILKVGEK